MHLATPHVEIDIFERHDTWKCLAQSAQFEDHLVRGAAMIFGFDPLLKSARLFSGAVFAASERADLQAPIGGGARHVQRFGDLPHRALYVEDATRIERADHFQPLLTGQKCCHAAAEYLAQCGVDHVANVIAEGCRLGLNMVAAQRVEDCRCMADRSHIHIDAERAEHSLHACPAKRS